MKLDITLLFVAVWMTDFSIVFAEERSAQTVFIIMSGFALMAGLFAHGPATKEGSCAVTDNQKTTSSEAQSRQAVGLYAVLAYDWSDFIDMVGEAEDGTLGILHQMLTQPNPKHSADTKELNSVGAGIVAAAIERRKELVNA